MAMGRIIAKKDNWKSHFESVFIDKPVLEHKMRIILSLRNDVKHGRSLDQLNSLRLRIHCYDILSQIYEKDSSLQYDKDILMQIPAWIKTRQHPRPSTAGRKFRGMANDALICHVQYKNDHSYITLVILLVTMHPLNHGWHQIRQQPPI